MKRFVYMFVLILLILLSLVACTEQSTLPPHPTVEPTSPSHNPGAEAATNYYQALQKHDYTKAFSYLRTDAIVTGGQRLTLNRLRELVSSTDNAEGPIESFSVAAFSPLVVMTITRKKLGPYHTHLQLKQENGGWRIASIDRV